jgi:hypothetical protein
MSCECGGRDKVLDAERERDVALQKLGACQRLLRELLAEVTPEQLGRARERLDFQDVTAGFNEQ